MKLEQTIRHFSTALSAKQKHAVANDDQGKIAACLEHHEFMYHSELQDFLRLMDSVPEAARLAAPLPPTLEPLQLRELSTYRSVLCFRHTQQISTASRCKRLLHAHFCFYKNGITCIFFKILHYHSSYRGTGVLQIRFQALIF